MLLIPWRVSDSEDQGDVFILCNWRRRPNHKGEGAESGEATRRGANSKTLSSREAPLGFRTPSFILAPPAPRLAVFVAASKAVRQI